MDSFAFFHDRRIYGITRHRLGNAVRLGLQCCYEQVLSIIRGYQALLRFWGRGLAISCCDLKKKNIYSVLSRERLSDILFALVSGIL